LDEFGVGLGVVLVAIWVMLESEFSVCFFNGGYGGIYFDSHNLIWIKANHFGIDFDSTIAKVAKTGKYNKNNDFNKE
jgi:hypothetical protein